VKGLSLGNAIVNAIMPKRNQKDITSLIEEFQYPKYGPGMMWEACREFIKRSERRHPGLVHARRAMVQGAGRDQRRPRAIGSAVGPHGKASIVSREVLDPLLLADGAERSCLLSHSGEQRFAGDAAREAGMIVRAGYEGRAAVAAVEQADGEQITGQIDRGGEPGGPGADYDAIVHWLA
jgi:hypothetical protein